ncbi:hypothetical protein CFC21_065790 [Triticum aestivum]|uniref:Uncharacterized protein n=2 Tax=Triticum aestivum TaxID=4565 RepID=A0A9R1KLT6_WHEAT|nr:uncharacterized protein LOC123107021 [Triticum aestivum]KAF7058809.1 hypothetical protein CFC21_065790 [Triticum aestivum]
MVDAPDGGARANGEATSSHSSSGEEDTPPVVHCGIVNDGQPLPRRPLDDATRVRERWWPRQTTEDAARRLVAWTRDGGSVRALLVVSVGSMASVPLTVLLIFTFLLAAATTTAIITSIVMSLAAAGGFMSVLFAFAAAMYIGAVSVAIIVISATTVATVVAITIASGWVAFFWILWFSAKRCMGLA